MRWHIFFGGCKFPSNMACTNLTLGNGPCIPIKMKEKHKLRKSVFFFPLKPHKSVKLLWLDLILYWYHDLIILLIHASLYCCLPKTTLLQPLPHCFLLNYVREQQSWRYRWGRERSMNSSKTNFCSQLSKLPFSSGGVVCI